MRRMITTPLVGLLAGIVWIVTMSLSHAYTLGPYLKDPLPTGGDATVLTVKTPDNPAGQAFSLPELEALGLQQLTIELVWDGESGSYQGVFLRDLLKAVGVADAPEILSTASDGYSVKIPQAMWTDGLGVIATRFDGALLDPEDKGPTRLLFPTQEEGGLTGETEMDFWIWNIETIEVR